MSCRRASTIKPQSGHPAEADTGKSLASFRWTMPLGVELRPTCSHQGGRSSSLRVRFATVTVVQLGQSDIARPWTETATAGWLSGEAVGNWNQIASQRSMEGQRSGRVARPQWGDTPRFSGRDYGCWFAHGRVSRASLNEGFVLGCWTAWGPMTGCKSRLIRLWRPCRSEPRFAAGCLDQTGVRALQVAEDSEKTEMRAFGRMRREGGMSPKTRWRVRMEQEPRDPGRWVWGKSKGRWAIGDVLTWYAGCALHLRTVVERLSEILAAVSRSMGHGTMRLCGPAFPSTADSTGGELTLSGGNGRLELRHGGSGNAGRLWRRVW